MEKSSVIIENELIVDVPRRQYIYDFSIDKLIDAEGGYIIPGVINNHAHGLTFGSPFFPSAEKALPRQRVIYHLNRHLLQGTTTLLNLDGFATMWEVEATNKLHPINIKTGTIHTSSNLKAAELVSGTGIQEKHRKLTVEEMLNLGAVAIGEVGGGDSLGGMAVDYFYIPKAIKTKTGKDIIEPQARALKDAVLSPQIEDIFISGAKTFDPTKVSKVLEQIGLADVLSVEEARRLINDTLLPSFKVVLKAFKESAALSKKFNVPMIVHNAAACQKNVLLLARELKGKLIAAHSNHTSFEAKEGIKQAKRLKEYGAIIDVYSMLENHTNLSETTIGMFREGVIDLISTDFIGGYWDSILLFIEKAVEEGVVNLPRAIAMATGSVARAIPGLAPNRSLITPDKIADIVITDSEKISKVNTVITRGEIIVENGKIK